MKVGCPQSQAEHIQGMFRRNPLPDVTESVFLIRTTSPGPNASGFGSGNAEGSRRSGKSLARRLPRWKLVFEILDPLPASGVRELHRKSRNPGQGLEVLLWIIGSISSPVAVVRRTMLDLHLRKA